MKTAHLKIQQSNRVGRIIISIIFFFLYIGTFLVAQPLLGNGISVLSIFPVILVILFFGLKWGILSSVFILVVNFHLFMNFINPQGLFFALKASIPGFIINLVGVSAAGVLLGFHTGFTKELEERELFERALQKSEQRYRSQFTNMIDGMAIDEIIYADGEPVDWVILDVNPAYEKIMNTTRDEVVGKSATTLYGFFGNIRPIVKDFDKALKTGQPVSKEIYSALHVGKILYTAFSMGENQVAVIFKEIEDQEKVLLAEKKHRDYMDTLATITSALNKTIKLDEVLDIILASMEKFVPFDAADITLIQDNRLKMARYSGYEKFGLEDFAKNFEVRLDEMLTTHWMLENKTQLIIADTSNSDLWTTFPEVNWIKSYLGIPIFMKGQLTGFLNFLSAKKGFYENFIVDQIIPFTEQAAFAIENSRLYKEVQELAVVDPLTKAYNRRGFAEIANREIEISHRFFRPLSLLFLDIDHFKEVNDVFGHAVGDQILFEIAERCRNSIRNVDVVSRHGGEEFLVLLMETGLTDGLRTARRIQAIIKDYPFQTVAGPISITVSVGVAEFNHQVEGLDALIHNADMALYKAKSSGRNQVIAFQSLDENSN